MDHHLNSFAAGRVILLAVTSMLGSACNSRDAAMNEPAQLLPPDQSVQDVAVASADSVAILHPELPTGPSTPEGVASDLARAFIQPDSELFKATCLAVTNHDEYTAFIEGMSEQMDALRGQSMERFGGPKEINTLYQARRLPSEGAASYGFAVMNLHDVKFVDVETELWDGSRYTNRTLVVQLPSGEWRVIPRPDLFPLLTRGLNSESASTDIWKAQSPTPAR